MGPLTPSQIEVYNHNPRYVGIKLPNVSKPETLVKKYFGKLSKRALSFMKGVLKMDPTERMTSQDCLEHPYFEGLPARERDRAALTASQNIPVQIASAPHNNHFLSSTTLQKNQSRVELINDTQELHEAHLPSVEKKRFDMVWLLLLNRILL